MRRPTNMIIMNPTNNARATAERIKAFAHATRLAILQELAIGPKCVTDIEEILPARQANISQHLAVLRHAGLVDYAQNGTLRCYYLCRPSLVKGLLAISAIDEEAIVRTPEDISLEKEKLRKAKAKAKKKKSTQKAAQTLRESRNSR